MPRGPWYGVHATLSIASATNRLSRFCFLWQNFRNTIQSLFLARREAYGLQPLLRLCDIIKLISDEKSVIRILPICEFHEFIYSFTRSFVCSLIYLYICLFILFHSKLYHDSSVEASTIERAARLGAMLKVI